MESLGASTNYRHQDKARSTPNGSRSIRFSSTSAGPWGSTWIAGARHEGCIQSQRRMQTYRQPSCQKIARNAPLKALSETLKEKRVSPIGANPLF